jgi:FkbM family methyltransferase
MSISAVKEKYKSSKLLKPDFIREMHKYHEVLFQFQQSLKSTDVQRIEISSEGVLFTIKHRALKYVGDGLKFYVDPFDHRMTPVETFNFDTYENDDFAMLVSLFKDGQTFFDIGGNIGFHSISLSRQFPNSQFFCFEPIPKTFNYLKKNAEINHIQNLQKFNIGFSNVDTTLEFFFYPEGSGNASSKNLTGRNDAEKIQAKVTTLDLFTNRNPNKIDFIKCDVEGAELFVFEGAINTIKRDRPIVFSEILRKWTSKFEYNPNQIFKFFEDLDYNAYVVKGSELERFTRMNDSTLETNFFFIPRENKI